MLFRCGGLAPICRQYGPRGRRAPARRRSPALLALSRARNTASTRRKAPADCGAGTKFTAGGCRQPKSGLNRAVAPGDFLLRFTDWSIDNQRNSLVLSPCIAVHLLACASD